MKKIFLSLLLMASLLLSGCSARMPDFSVKKDMEGTVIQGDIQFDISSDFSGTPTVTIKSRENAYDIIYEFSEDSVALICGEIRCDYAFEDLPRKNIPVTVYKVLTSLEDEKNFSWDYDKKAMEWNFEGKISGMSIKGACDDSGKVLSFYIPEINTIYQTLTA